MKFSFKILLFLFYFGSLSCAIAQVNLVPNPSFELYDTCPNSTGQVSRALGWNSFCETPDYFNSCSSLGGTIPVNFAGNQYPLTGNAYCGLWTYSTTWFYREIIGIQLSTALVVGQKYFVSFNAVLADVYGSCATDKLGAKFSTSPFNSLNPVPINNLAKVYSSSIITDTANWSSIRGSFIADSAYNYVMIGNFFDDINTDTIQMNGSAGCFSYYYIENVCVSTDSIYATNWTSINEIKSNFEIQLFPNPVINGVCSLKSSEIIESIDVYNSLGKKIRSTIIVNSDLYQIDFKNMTKGVYFIEIKINQKYYTYKIVLIN
jgi:Secretion system C-terminal sorting domain